MRGIKRGNKAIQTEIFPDRKKPCLVCEEGNAGTIVATFRSEEEVKLFWEYVDYVCFGNDKAVEE